MTQARIDHLITQLNLKPHPEGGYYCEQYRSSCMMNSPLVNKPRVCLTHIYFLLTQGQLSRWHKIEHDEIWNFYEGDPLRILKYDGTALDDSTIGGIGRDVKNDYFKVVKAGIYQAAETTGLYSLVGCSVAPGFEFDDFSYIDEEASQRKIYELGKDYARFL